MATFMDDLEGIGGHELDRRKVEQTSKETENSAAPGAPRQAMSPSSVLAMQRAVGNAGTTTYLQRDEEEAEQQRSPVHNVIGGGGEALDASTRSTMEEHLGHDLSDVRVHLDRGSAESVQAAAYTVGNDIVLHPDHFSAGTPAAQRTMAHELTHVVQQRSGPVAGTPREGGIKVSDPSDRFEQEAEESASRLMSSSAQPMEFNATASRPAAAVQRQDEEDETEVQEISLQRQDEEDETEVQEISLQRQDEEDEEESSE